MRGKINIVIELKIFCFDIILNYHLSQKLKRLKNSKFNHLIIILTKKQVKKNELRA